MKLSDLRTATAAKKKKSTEAESDANKPLDKHPRSLTLPAIELRQDGTRLLLTRMRAGDLADFTSIDRFDNSKSFDDPTQGYQRPAESLRIKKFANWLRREAQDGGKIRMPTAILLSARTPDIVLSPSGTIVLSTKNKLALVDGQHRAKGFEYAINEKGLSQFSDFEVPVVIMQDIDKIAEMKQFRTVNGEQKSVRTDLVNMILTQLVEQRGESAIEDNEHWKVVATQVVKRLNEDPDGPWFDRIVMPDQASYSKIEQQQDPNLRHKRTARATSFITALKPIERLMKGQTIEARAEQLFHVIDGFWRAVRELNPGCFDEADDYVMQKTPGIFALHQLCLRVMNDMSAGFRDWEQSEFRFMLERCPEISNPEYWFVGTDETDRGDGAKYGSMKGFSELADLLYENFKASRS